MKFRVYVRQGKERLFMAAMRANGIFYHKTEPCVYEVVCDARLLEELNGHMIVQGYEWC